MLLSYKLQLDLKRLMQNSKRLLFRIRVEIAMKEQTNVRLVILKFIVSIKQKNVVDILLHVVMQMISFNNVKV